MADQNTELKMSVAEHIALLKKRNKQMSEIVNVEADLKVKEKEQLGVGENLKNKMESGIDGMLGSAEASVASIFGPGLGGLISTLTIGFISRANERRKERASVAKQEKKQQEKVEREGKKTLEAMQDRVKGLQELATQRTKGGLGKSLTKEAQEAKKVLKTKVEFQTKEQQEKTQALIKEGKTRKEALKEAGTSSVALSKITSEEVKQREDFLFENKESAAEIETEKQEQLGVLEHITDTSVVVPPEEEKGKEKKEQEGLGGAVVSVATDDVVDAAVGKGEVTASEGMSLDTTNQLLTDIEGHLAFMTDNMEDAESRRERLRKQGGKVAPKKGEKKKDDEGFSFAGFMGTILGAITGAIMGTVAGLAIGFVNMWKMIFKFIGGKLAKMFPNVTKMLSNVFGKGGHISKFFTAIKAFFTENKAFKTISDGFTKFKTSIKSFGTSVMKFINPILKLFSGGSGGGALSGFSKFKGAFKTFFRVFKTFFSKIFLPLQVIISLFDGFFEAKDAAGKSEGMLATFFNSIIGFFGGILDGLVMGTLDLIKDGISWIAGFLGFEDVEKFLDSFSFSDMFNEFLDDIYAWFNLLFSDPLAALGQLWDSLTGGVASIVDFIYSPIKSGIAWVMRLFGWDDAAAATEAFSIGGFISGVFASIKEWFGKLFKFDSTSDIIASLVNVVTFIPNMIKDAIAAVTVWLLELFGFGDAAKGIADVNKFSLGEMLMNTLTSVKDWFLGLFAWGKEAGTTASGDFSIIKMVTEAVDAISKWFSELFDSITNFDFAKFARGIMPDFLADMIFGKGESEVEKPAEAKKAETAAQGGESEKLLEKPDTGGMFDAILNPFRTYVKDLLADTTGIPEWVENIVLSAIPGGGGEVENTSARGSIIKKRAAKGAIVTKPAYLPASGTVVGEHSSWSGKGAAAGAIPDGPGGEAIIPLAGERGGAILAEALAPAIAGAILNELMMARVGGGAEGGSAPTVIQDNSTNQNVTNTTIVRTPSPSGPGLHFEGRDFVHKIA